MSAVGPFFSIIVPAYNRADTVGRTIGSVTKQSYSSWEIVVVDDGSTDDTALRIRELRVDNRIRYFHQENQGVCAARNAGVERSGGRYLLFFDSDDEMADDFLAAAYTLISSSGEAECFCFSTVFKRPGKEDNFLKPDQLGALYGNKKGLFLAGTFVILKEAFQRVGGYDSQLAFGENDELGQRICKQTDIVCSDTLSLISHRVTKKEKNTRYKREVMAKTLSHYLDVYLEELRRVDRPRLISINNRLAICYFVMKEDKHAVSILVNTIRNYTNFKSIRILTRIVLFPGLYRKFLNDKGLV